MGTNTFHLESLLETCRIWQQVHNLSPELGRPIRLIPMGHYRAGLHGRKCKGQIITSKGQHQQKDNHLQSLDIQCTSSPIFLPGSIEVEILVVLITHKVFHWYLSDHWCFKKMWRYRRRDRFSAVPPQSLLCLSNLPSARTERLVMLPKSQLLQ